MPACGCIFHMPSQGDLYRGRVRTGGLRPVVCKLLCTTLGARSCPRARDTGQPAGKAMGWGETRCPAGFRALPGKQVGRQQGLLARGRTALQGGQNAEQIPAGLPARARHTCAALPAPLCACQPSNVGSRCPLNVSVNQMVGMQTKKTNKTQNHRHSMSTGPSSLLHFVPALAGCRGKEGASSLAEHSVPPRAVEGTDVRDPTSTGMGRKHQTSAHFVCHRL